MNPPVFLRQAALFLLFIVLLLAGAATAGPPQLAPDNTFTISLDAGPYSLHTDGTGRTRIEMVAASGTFAAPGEPALPGRTFLIALPPGVTVTDVSLSPADPVPVDGRYQIAAAAPLVKDPADEAALSRWHTTHDLVFLTDDIYPAQPARYRGQGQWRRYTFARVAFTPFAYRPASGTLSYYPSLTATFTYHHPAPGSQAAREVERLSQDRVLDEMAGDALVNYESALRWYGEEPDQPQVTAASVHDYVVVVADDTMAETVAFFKSWKETLGHNVRIVTLPWIQSSYSGADLEEEIWNFLHDKYPASNWGIHYVLLVGDMQTIPTRRVYYSDPLNEWGLRSDHFYARLSGGSTAAAVWNSDGDHRWGEIDGDEMTIVPDVLVGRIPLNSTTDVTAALQAIITAEQDSGSWKHNALLGGVFNDIIHGGQKTDMAVPLEHMRITYLEPDGWSSTRLFEQSGVGTSSYTPPPDGDISTANVVSTWNNGDYGLVVLAGHGDFNGIQGRVWDQDINGDGNTFDTAARSYDPGEVTSPWVFTRTEADQITDTSHPSLVWLIGCFTNQLVGQPWPNPDQSVSTPGSYTDNTGARLLRRGVASGIIGFYSPVPYQLYWTSPNGGNMQTMGSYVLENLVQKDYNLGWAIYEAKIRFTNDYYVAGSYQPIPWALSIFGDPAMILEGVDQSALGSNKLIHSGALYAYGTDNADGGDMYVAASTQADSATTDIAVYRSTDQGESWQHWTTVTYGSGTQSLDVIVGEYGSGEFVDPRLHVFIAAADGKVWDTRIDLDDPNNSSSILISNEGSNKTVGRIKAARTPLTDNFYLHATWEVKDDTLGTYQVKIARGTNNGIAWSTPSAFGGYEEPHVDADPDGKVYLVALGSSFPRNVYVKISSDYGVSWSGWHNLTSGDEGLDHAAPTVAASTDAGAYPVVWVAYTFYETTLASEADLHYAYSENGGSSWTTQQRLSAVPGIGESMPDMVGYRSSASRWMNIAYFQERADGTNNVVWRWVSGSTPANWWAARLINDHAAAPVFGPQIIYSPGAGSGSGVVYPGYPATNLYFAAPWLSANTVAPLPTLRPDAAVAATTPPDSPTAPTLVPQEPFNWVVAGEEADVRRCDALARGADGVFYAACTASEPTGANRGVVFRSEDNGLSWSETAALPNAWVLESLLVTGNNTLLAGGMHKGGDQARAALYRSPDGGTSWTAVLTSDLGSTIHTLAQMEGSEILVAGSGEGGVLFISEDDGATWVPWITLPGMRDVFTLLPAGDQLYAGGSNSVGEAAVFVYVNDGWEATGTLDDATAVRSLALLPGSPDRLYAGVASAGYGQLFRSEDGGSSWSALPVLENSTAVPAMAADPASGRLYAGLNMGQGNYSGRLYLSEDGGDNWQSAGYLLAADTVHDLLFLGHDLLVASGDVYGTLYRAAYMAPGALAPSLAIAPLGADADLWWPADMANCSYEIYTSASPYFQPESGVLLDPPGTAPLGTAGFVVSGGLGTPASPAFYRVLAGDCAQTDSALSNEVGAFSFALALP